MNLAQLQWLHHQTTEQGQQKNCNGIQPLIVTPSTKNRDILTCTCSTHHLFYFCQHMLAVSADNNMISGYMSEILKKLELEKKTKKPMISITSP